MREMENGIKNEREVNPIYFPSQRVLGVNLNYFFFLAAFLAVFFADFFAAFFADFAIALLFFLLNDTKSYNIFFIHKNFSTKIFLSEFFFRVMKLLETTTSTS